jgi:alkanesulfonate monooxygenase SsuD/methylene tetrahydromethanopterin reductase-like flavin-dependent oxidoreductase (luciferase family)
MASIGIHASHEQVPPSDLLTAMRDAEAAGFQCAWSSDHFSPWSERQGESGFAWAWLGAAMQSTTLPFGVVTAPGQRYHPAIVAQAAATLAELFPGRLSVALGTGEYSNEHITGAPWPDKRERGFRPGRVRVRTARTRRRIECRLFGAIARKVDTRCGSVVRVFEPLPAAEPLASLPSRS